MRPRQTCSRCIPQHLPARCRRRAASSLSCRSRNCPRIETERIALYLNDGHRLDYYSDAKWSAALDELLQDFLVQEAQKKMPASAVGTTDLAASARYRLAVKFADFEPVYADGPDKAPTLTVAMTMTVVSLPGEKVQAQFTVRRTAPASANTLTAVTDGLETLLKTSTDEALQRAAPYLGGSEKEAKAE